MASKLAIIQTCYASFFCGVLDTVYWPKTMKMIMKFSQIEWYFVKQSEFECTLCKAIFVVGPNATEDFSFNTCWF